MKAEQLMFKMSLLAAFCRAVWMCGVYFWGLYCFMFWAIDWMWTQKQTQGERNIYRKELILSLFLLLYMCDWNCCGLSSNHSNSTQNNWGSLLVPWALVVCRHLRILNPFSNWATWQGGLILKMLFRIAVCCVKKKNNKNSLKLHVFETTTSRRACVCLGSTEEKQDPVGWVLPASLSPAALAAPGSPCPGQPRGSLCPLQAPACVFWSESLQSVSVHMLQFVPWESGGHLEDSICVQWENQECTWVAEQQHTELRFLYLGVCVSLQLFTQQKGYI